MPRRRNMFRNEFKNLIIQLSASGVSREDIVRDYDLSAASLNRWIKRGQERGLFTEKVKRVVRKSNELIALRKENQQLKIENSLLKQAVLKMGRKRD